MIRRLAILLGLFAVDAPAAPPTLGVWKDGSGQVQQTTGVAIVPSAAASTPLQGAVTASGVTPSSGAATFATGTATIGPLVPELGRPVRVILKGTWSGTFALGTSTDGCATINPLTIAGQAFGRFSGNANEIVDEAWLAGVSYCATATVASGTLTYAVRQ